MDKTLQTSGYDKPHQLSHALVINSTALRRNQLKWCCLFLLSIAQVSHACINTSERQREEDYEFQSQDPYVELLKSRMAATPATQLEVLAGAPSDHHDYRLRYVADARENEVEAVRLILTGEYDSAIAVLEAMEAANPGDYNTAANLGTAYELAGNNEAALKWISEGIARNPNAHQGTEWLHEAVLRAKVAMEKNPNYLRTRHILPLREGFENSPGLTAIYGDATYTGLTLLKALYYQLGERMLFVKPRDPIVADLLYTLALVESHSENHAPAVELSRLSEKYGYENRAEIQDIVDKYRASTGSGWITGPREAISMLVGFTLLCLPMLVLILSAGAIARWMRGQSPTQ